MKKGNQPGLYRILATLLVVGGFAIDSRAQTIKAQRAIGDPSDLFQTLGKVDILSHSALHPAGFLIEDMFSAYNPVDQEDVIFTDTSGASVSFISFSTPDPVHFTQLVIGLANDYVAGSDNDGRTCSNIKLYGSLSLDILMGEKLADIAIDPEYTDAYGRGQIVVDIPLDVDAQYFQVEFLAPRGHGIRVFEIDGYGDILYPDPTPSPSIVGCSSVFSNVVKMVVDAPSQAHRYYPQGTPDLLPGSELWSRVAHSDNGVNPFVFTNLSYSSSDTATGTNKVIYLQADRDVGFLEMAGDVVRSATIAKELSDYFDNVKPSYPSSERQYALRCIDTLVNHHPAPHDDWVKDLFLNRYQKSIDDIKNTDVQTGAEIWNVYNMVYIVKTKEITVAFDLTRLPSSLREEVDGNQDDALAKELVDLSDILFVSHIHGDHADKYVAGEFIKQNKPVIAPPDVFTGEDFYSKITPWTPDGEQRNLPIPARNTELLLRIYPGHQQVSATGTVDNNFSVVTLPNGIVVAHSGDQAWADDFSWIDSVHNDVAIDVLMVNTWTQDPNRLVVGLEPIVALPGHVNEMMHGVGIAGGRIPFWQSDRSWRNANSEVVHLFWGEPFRVEGAAKAVLANGVEE